MDRITVKNSYIPWSFLDIIAREDGIFAKRDLEVDLFSVPPKDSEPADKVAWYSGMVKDGTLDAYSVCAWGAIDRLAETKREKILAASTSSGYAFSILVAPGLGIKTAADLAEIPIAVNMKTGSHYCILSDLERVLPYSKIKVVHGAEPSSRLQRPARGEVPGDRPHQPLHGAGGPAGLRQGRRDEDRRRPRLRREGRPPAWPTLTRYLACLDEAAKKLKANPEAYRDLYVSTFRETFRGFPDEWRTRINKLIDKIAPTIPITTWGDLTEYPKESFNSLSTWMSKHNLLEANVQYENLVLNQPLEKVSTS